MQIFLQRLIMLYNETTLWHTRRQILSAFVGDCSKTELLCFIPGPTKWRIDEARKHAFVVSPEQVIEPPVLQRCRLDPAKINHFLDFTSSPTFLQDVAYGTKIPKLSSGKRIEISNVLRTVVASRLIQLCQSYCKEYGFAPLGQSTLFNIVKPVKETFTLCVVVSQELGRERKISGEIKMIHALAKPRGF